MNKIPCILSLTHKKQIDEACKALPDLGVKNFSMSLSFNDGGHFFISNDYSVSPGYHNWLFKEDPISSSAVPYAPQQVRGLKSDAEKAGMASSVFNLTRSHSECFFVFSAEGDFRVGETQLFLKQFEEFCIHFVDVFSGLIIASNPNYRFSFVLNNKLLRDAVIRQGYETEISLSLREQECLWHAGQGKSAKEIGRELCLSPYTVEQYLKRIRKLFDGKKLPEIMLECIHRGIIGKVGGFNKKQSFFKTHQQPVSIN